MPWREPLLHFLVLAGLLFAFEQFWSARQKERIVVDRSTAEFLIQQREDLELRALTPEERRETIESYIEDEILYREAYRRGLDKDTRARRNLILKMRGLSLAEMRDPAPEELREYFEANRERFRSTPRISLDQAYFREAASIPGGLLEALRDGRPHDELGEDLQGLRRRSNLLSARALAGMLGPDAARAILALEDERWHGPIESRRGFHFVRVTERRPARGASFEQVEAYLAQEWSLAQARLAVEAEVARVRDEYEVVVEADGVLP